MAKKEKIEFNGELLSLEEAKSKVNKFKFEADRYRSKSRYLHKMLVAGDNSVSYNQVQAQSSYADIYEESWRKLQKHIDTYVEKNKASSSSAGKSSKPKTKASSAPVTSSRGIGNTADKPS